MGASLWRVRSRQLDLSARTAVMGILNVTPDSISDGGKNLNPDVAVEAGLQMLADGADILDIGGESTRPGRPETVDIATEIARVIPVLKIIRRQAPEAIISVDTYKGDVAREALAAGADIINDVYALGRSPEIASLCAEHSAGLMLMHMKGEPATMQENPVYGDVIVEIKDLLKERMDLAIRYGVAEEQIAVDPGVGFGKTVEHNLQILASLEYLRLLQRPIGIGVSRKGFLGAVTGGLPVEEREEATVAACTAAVLNGASIVRVHNVKAARRGMDVVDAIRAQM
ncbi:MAG: dihydropteroate synthase [Candidatus Sumerlaeaceae bacterium]|nr:dihydropteroate synthase [Candidatus Sumerlaeaceae bacterium]